MECIRRRKLELGEVLIEPASRIRLGVDEQGASADGIGGLGRPQQNLLQPGSAEPASLFAEVDPESSEQDDRDRVAAGSSRDPRRCVGRLQRAAASAK